MPTRRAVWPWLLQRAQNRKHEYFSVCALVALSRSGQCLLCFLSSHTMSFVAACTSGMMLSAQQRHLPITQGVLAWLNLHGASRAVALSRSVLKIPRRSWLTLYVVNSWYKIHSRGCQGSSLFMHHAGTGMARRMMATTTPPSPSQGCLGRMRVSRSSTGPQLRPWCASSWTAASAVS